MARRMQFSYIADARAHVVVDGVQNAHRSFAVNRPEVAARFGRPHDGILLHEPGSTAGKSELAEDIVVRDALALIQ